MSNNEKQQTPVEWLYRWILDNPEATIPEGIKAFEKSKEMLSLREKELIQQYEKKISDLLDRLVLKQDEVIAILKEQQNPVIECKACLGDGTYTEYEDGRWITYDCKECNGSGYNKQK